MGEDETLEERVGTETSLSLDTGKPRKAAAR